MTTIAEEQHMRITGTVVAAILNCNPYMTEVEAQQKVQGKAPEFPTTEPMRHGLILEQPYGLMDREAEKHYGTMPQQPPGIMIHPEHGFLGAHLDRTMVRSRPEIEILEYKTTSVQTGWGANLTDEVPLHVYWQVAHQLLVCPGPPRAHIQAFLGVGDMRFYVIEREDVDLAKLEYHLVDWYDRHITRGVPVEPSSEADARLLWPKESESTKEATKPVQVILAALCANKDDIESLEKVREGYRRDLMKELGNAEGFHDPKTGDVLLRWKQKSSTRLDATRLKKEDPETYNNLLDLFPKVSTTRAFTPVWTRLDKLFGREK